MRGAPPGAPAMRVCLVRYAYGVGGGARRKSAWAGARQGAFMALGGDVRPRSDGRPWPLAACQEGWVQGVRVAGAAGCVPVGHVSPDGTQRQTPGPRGTGGWSEQSSAGVPSLLAAGSGAAPWRRASGRPDASSAHAVALWECLTHRLRPSGPAWGRARSR